MTEKMITITITMMLLSIAEAMANLMVVITMAEFLQLLLFQGIMVTTMMMIMMMIMKLADKEATDLIIGLVGYVAELFVDFQIGGRVGLSVRAVVEIAALFQWIVEMLLLLFLAGVVVVVVVAITLEVIPWILYLVLLAVVVVVVVVVGVVEAAILWILTLV
jgi:hypothetical protein